MKAVILFGGLGARLSEKSDVRPRPVREHTGKSML